MTRLAGSTVLVTGANRGIGAELVRQLLDTDVAMVYAAARHPQRITIEDPRVIPIAIDVTDVESIGRAASTVQALDVLINNAGIASSTPVLNAGASTLRRELETNLFGPLAVTTAFAGHLPDDTGAVVTIASVASWIGLAGTYGVSKAAVWSAIDSMRLELAPRGIQVTAVHMAGVDTELTAGSTAPKSPPAVIVQQILQGIETGVPEILGDDLTRSVRASLPEPIDAQIERFAPYAR